MELRTSATCSKRSRKWATGSLLACWSAGRHVLKQRGPRPLLRMSKRLPTELTERAGVREHLGYLCKREGLMQYPQFQHQGWPIGSGMVESANKLVVEARRVGSRYAISNAAM
jgi:hypothetical protein